MIDCAETRTKNDRDRGALLRHQWEYRHSSTEIVIPLNCDFLSGTTSNVFHPSTDRYPKAVTGVKATGLAPFFLI